MITLKFIFKISFLLFLFLLFARTSYANEKAVKIHFFYGDGCPHCAAEEKFLNTLDDSYKERIEIERYEVWRNTDNLKILSEVSNDFGKNYSGVPVTIIGKTYISGYLSDQTTGLEIKNVIDNCLKNPNDEICIDAVSPLFDKPETPVISDVFSNTPTIKLPLFGEINPQTISLPLITVVIGLLDGFNPCAMWTLLFLISILLGMKDKRRRWVLGIVFIIASGFVYFLFMAAWLNFFLLLGFVSWIRLIIGVTAIIFGSYHIWKFYKDRKGGCVTSEEEKRQKVFEKIKKVTKNRKIYLALIGIVMLAFAVNLIELVCSAGFPAIYTGILALNNLPKLTYYLYLLFYIFFFMLDDIIVFSIAMLTLEAVGIQSKYARISSFVGGILLAMIGILLILKPGILMLNF
ncbi:MAG: hypothetical protein ABIB98_02660 [bacterium]